MSITALVARRIGENNRQRASVLAGQAIVIGIILSIVIGALGIALICIFG